MTMTKKEKDFLAETSFLGGLGLGLEQALAIIQEYKLGKVKEKKLQEQLDKVTNELYLLISGYEERSRPSK
jgi:hypothetical protein